MEVRMTDVSDNLLDAEVILQEVAYGHRWLVRREVRAAADVVLYEFDSVRGRLRRLEEERENAYSCMENAVAAMKVDNAARNEAVEQVSRSLQELATTREQLAKADADNTRLFQEMEDVSKKACETVDAYRVRVEELEKQLHDMNQDYGKLHASRRDVIRNDDRRSKLLCEIRDQVIKEFNS
jgi:DNA repair exonuclease SbcCD ATPase subunit